ncbi:MAG: hypothetical protein ACE5J6_00615 [Candidatus Bathyarchaeia archaeon]
MFRLKSLLSFFTPIVSFQVVLKILPPQVQEVRIVEIKDWHACACGGTHLKNTGEIGTVKILKKGF